VAKVAGILNVTPDSFSDGGEFLSSDVALRHAELLVEQGADIIDIGGESSRPGSSPVPAEEEMKRVLPVIRAVKKRFGVPVSVDTYKSEVARAALGEGADIVNDITGLGYDGAAMADVVSAAGAGLIIMHIKGTPENMQEKPEYDDIIKEISAYFSQRLELALAHGVKREKIIFDPGIGFGKLPRHNLEILKHLSRFSVFGLPIMVGPSRKAFIGLLLDAGVKDRLEGTIAACVVSVMNGAEYLRVHDVGQVKKAVKIAEAILNA
jgi:dihydropteroate synthase